MAVACGLPTNELVSRDALPHQQRGGGSGGRGVWKALLLCLLACSDPLNKRRPPILHLRHSAAARGASDSAAAAAHCKVRAL